MKNVMILAAFFLANVGSAQVIESNVTEKNLYECKLDSDSVDNVIISIVGPELPKRSDLNRTVSVENEVVVTLTFDGNDQSFIFPANSVYFGGTGLHSRSITAETSAGLFAVHQLEAKGQFNFELVSLPEQLGAGFSSLGCLEVPANTIAVDIVVH